MTTAEPGPLLPLLSDLVDDTSLLTPRAAARPVADVLAAHLAARDAEHGWVVGQLVCPISRLSALLAETAKVRPARPVELSLMVDTGLGAVPKALSTAMSRPSLLTPRTVHTAAPPDVDPVWLERVTEFIPDDVTAVVEPRRPTVGSTEATAAWLAAVRRVAEYGCVPKLRCGGPRPSDEPSPAEVGRFVRAVAAIGRPFIALGLPGLVRSSEPAAAAGPGVLNLLVALPTMLERSTDDGPDAEASGPETEAAWRSTDRAALLAALAGQDPATAKSVRSLLARCGIEGPIPSGDLLGPVAPG